MLHSELFEAHTNKSKAIIFFSKGKRLLRKFKLCYHVNSENLVGSQTQNKGFGLA